MMQYEYVIVKVTFIIGVILLNDSDTSRAVMKIHNAMCKHWFYLFKYYETTIFQENILSLST